MRILLALLLVLLLPFATSCNAPGQKLLKMEVLAGGELILTTRFDVPDRSSTSEMWDAAGEVPFSTEVLSPTLHTSTKDPLVAKLAGSVVIRILHVSTLETEATLAGLTLVRSSDTETDWHLAKSDVAAAKAAAEK